MKSYKRFEIVDLSDDFPGSGASIYSIALDDDEKTLYDRFIEENESLFPDELTFIDDRLQAIARLGARPNFFKEGEGRFGTGDGVVALYDEPHSNLRLYCVRFGSVAIILGGGGPKSKDIRRFQEDPKLTEENYLLRMLSLRINKAIRDGDIDWDGNRLVGELIIGDEQ